MPNDLGGVAKYRFQHAEPRHCSADGYGGHRVIDAPNLGQGDAILLYGPSRPRGIFAEAFKWPAEVPAIACATIAETAAENFVALTRRAGAVLRWCAISMTFMSSESTTMRQTVLTGEIMQSDAETYGGHVAADCETAIATLKTLANRA
jgi:hypothetical protein